MISIDDESLTLESMPRLANGKEPVQLDAESRANLCLPAAR
jgi:hypothetical protein